MCYGAGLGDWFLADGNTGHYGNGAFPGISYPEQRGVRLIDITDGDATTIGFSEVEAFTGLLGRYSSQPGWPAPAGPGDVLALGGEMLFSAMHTSWASGLGNDTGISFVFSPNTPIYYTDPASGQTYDVDWTAGANYQYGVYTARSYHPGGVNTLFMDGSVRFITNSIPQATWRALGTRNGGEAVVIPE